MTVRRREFIALIGGVATGCYSACKICKPIDIYTSACGLEL